MQSWKSFTANLPAVDMTSVRKNLGNTYQATRYVVGLPLIQTLPGSCVVRA